ncbi:hypothetical protein [Streptomyces sp. 769]|uniref:hypothetical protein n=1 Tax=Streptomyces sp. 769 TaxID=1262452 RepID=UPI000581F7F2|nr:hypothetical protein [Streptomyces sp. 769]AJC62040.1 hypothetical protein GZL_p00110 [Streptomyces sp. 769]
MLDNSHKITADELREIFARLQPYLPKQLKKVEPHPGGYGLGYEFTPFTGREEEPSAPSTYSDPKLKYIPESEDEVEHLRREKARVVLSNVYEKAREEWKDAAYVADMKTAVQDAPARWKTYQHERKTLEAAYAYLRNPDAATEWPSAVSRLIDAQDRTKAAAARFDQRAERIAEVHEKHLYADLGQDAALSAAGYPEAKDWHVTEVRQYGQNYYSDCAGDYAPLEEQVRRLIERQEAHVAKVGRLSGLAISSD